MHHARMVRRLFSYIGEGGHIPHEWFAAEVARLDNVAGDIEALADRLAGIRSWAYIAQRADWLADPAKWAERTTAVEARLSDALHERLTQRFVDRRTAVLVRDIGARGADALPVTVAADGEVSVGPEPIGHLAGFEFRVDPTARLADKRLLLAAAERRLGDELDRRAAKLCEAPDAEFRLVEEAGGIWPSAGTAMACPARARPLAARAGGAHRPGARPPVGRAPHQAARPGSRDGSRPRSTRHLPALKALANAAAGSHGHARHSRAGGDAGRCRRPFAAPSVAAQLSPLDKDDRHALHRLRVRLGALDVYVQSLLKPAAQQWRARLLPVRSGQPMPRLPEPSAATLDGSADPRGAALAFRRSARLAAHRPGRPAGEPRPPGPPAWRRRSGRPGAGDQPRPRRGDRRPPDGRGRLRARRARPGPGAATAARAAASPAAAGNAFAALAGPQAVGVAASIATCSSSGW